MSDNDLQYDSDEYHEDSYHDLDHELHRDDSLPDLVLSSTLTQAEPDLLLEPPCDLETEYFSTGDQVNTMVDSKDGNIRVKYTDTEKDYITHRISSCADKYRSYLNITHDDDESEDSESLQEEFKSLSPETQAMQRAAWTKELQSLETEIETLEARVRRKVKHAQHLKRSLGVTAWREFSDDVKDGMRKFQDSPMYLKVQAELESLASKFEEETTWMRSKASSLSSEHMTKASSLTSEHLASAQQKLTKKLQEIGLMEPPKQYRSDNSQPLMSTSTENPSQ